MNSEKTLEDLVRDVIADLEEHYDIDENDGPNLAMRTAQKLKRALRQGAK